MPIPRRLGGGQLECKALEFFTDVLRPNVDFQCSMAHAILRHNGNCIGQADVLGMKPTP